MKSLICSASIGVFIFGLSISVAQGLNLDVKLPSWPISDVAEAIPDELIATWRGKADNCKGVPRAFSSFPSKGTIVLTDNKGGSRAPSFAGEECDDGDQTLFNGMLCAAGVTEGCSAVAASQAASGRWFRSPARRWLWSYGCFSATSPLTKPIFEGRCAKGFSPDMGLGVLLYVVRTGDATRYGNWLRWMDGIAATTELCKRDGDKFVDCRKVSWPRVCTVDMGHDDSDESPPVEIDGRVGGRCALRPWDALDYAVVNTAIDVTMPPRMNAYEQYSRAFMKATLSVIGGDVAPVPPLVLLSSFEGKHFPIHLDATRVLLRMMIRNPSLELKNLPDLPSPADLVNMADPFSSLDASDPLSINAAAQIIASRVRWNPYYQLLASGPTNGVRQSILDHCPNAADKTTKGNWIWEKGTEADGDKLTSMGWDCVFVASLFNKMRVRADLVAELLDLFLKYADQTEAALTLANNALARGEAALRLADDGVRESEQALLSAQRFVDSEYAIARASAVDALGRANSDLANVNSKISSLQKQAVDLAAEAAALPEKIESEVQGRVCESLPWPINELCKTLTEKIQEANPLRADKFKQVANLEKERLDLESGARRQLGDQVVAATQQIAALDTKLQSLTSQLQQKTLQTAIAVARLSLASQQRLLESARDVVVNAKKLHRNVQSRLAVWRKK